VWKGAVDNGRSGLCFFEPVLGNLRGFKKTETLAPRKSSILGKPCGASKEKISSLLRKRRNIPLRKIRSLTPPYSVAN